MDYVSLPSQRRFLPNGSLRVHENQSGNRISRHNISSLTGVFFEPKNEFNEMFLYPQIIWVCQRELQKNVAQSWSKDESLPVNATLTMFFILGFPCLRMKKVQEPEFVFEKVKKECMYRAFRHPQTGSAVWM